MAYGFEVTNGAKQVIVSSDVKSLHFVEKATFTSVLLQVPPTDWNSGGWHVVYWEDTVTEMYYDGSTYVMPHNAGDYRGTYYTVPTGRGAGSSIYRYITHCNSVPVPFFSQPGWEFAGIIGVTSLGGGQWAIDIAQSGDPNGALRPEVYIFAEADGNPTPFAANENYGLKVMAANGDTCFDSRRMPLNVTNGCYVHSGYPAVSYLDSSMLGAGLGGKNNPYYVLTASNQDACSRYGVDTSIEAFVSIFQGNVLKPIFNYYSIANCEQEFFLYGAWHEEESGFLGFSSSSTTWETSAWFWCFFRSGIQSTGESILTSWIAIENGARVNTHTSSSGSSWWGASGSDSSSAGSFGSFPFTNQSKNLDPQFVMIADGSLYD